MARKIKVGWFSFTCCEDSTILFIELLNDKFSEWREKTEFVHARILQDNNRWEPMDIAFVEGAISSKHDEETVLKIRSLAQKVVAIGSCACTGMPSAQRNQFDEATRREIQFIIDRFGYLPRVSPLKEVIKVDYEVPGCPMDEKKFLEVFEGLISEFEKGQN
jgi:coenzyme F420-reducing hydrogenase gamma subunit